MNPDQQIREWVVGYRPDLKRAVDEGYALGSAPAEEMADMLLGDADGVVVAENNPQGYSWGMRKAPVDATFEILDRVKARVDKVRKHFPACVTTTILPIMRVTYENPKGSKVFYTAVVVELKVPGCPMHYVIFNAERTDAVTE